MGGRRTQDCELGTETSGKSRISRPNLEGSMHKWGLLGKEGTQLPTDKAASCFFVVSLFSRPKAISCPEEAHSVRMFLINGAKHINSSHFS